MSLATETGNPAFRVLASSDAGAPCWVAGRTAATTMTVQGTIGKTFLLLRHPVGDRDLVLDARPGELAPASCRPP